MGSFYLRIVRRINLKKREMWNSVIPRAFFCQFVVGYSQCNLYGLVFGEQRWCVVRIGGCVVRLCAGDAATGQKHQRNDVFNFHIGL